MVVGSIPTLHSMSDLPEERRVRGLYVSHREIAEALKLYRRLTGCTCAISDEMRAVHYDYSRQGFAVVVNDSTAPVLEDGMMINFCGCGCRRHELPDDLLPEPAMIVVSE